MLDKASEGFQARRQAVLNYLLNIHYEFTSDRKAFTQLKERLQAFVYEIGEFKAIAERGRYPISRCFSERSERIARATWDTSMMIETKDIEAPEIEQILEMIRVNIGRLSLNPYDGEDLNADGCDQEVDRINAGRRKMSPAVLEVWTLLDLSLTKCKCRQCQKRFGC